MGTKEQRDAVAAMIAAIEQNKEPFDAAEERWVRLTVTRVLEDLEGLRDWLEDKPPPIEAPPRAPDRAGIVLLRDVRRASGLGLREAKRLCEEADWDRERAMAAARGGGDS